MTSPPPKRPPAPSVTERHPANLNAQIAAELYTAVQRLLTADDEMLRILGDWREATTDEEVLAALKEYNARHRAQ
jgi:hypothetical protein